MSGSTQSKSSPSTTYIELAKVALMIVGGVWALYLYDAHGKEEKYLTNQILQSQRTQEQQRTVQTTLQVEALGQSRLIREGTLEVVDLGPYGENADDRLFFVNFAYSLTNNGTVPLEITYVSAETYLGHVGLQLEKNQVYGLNPFGKAGPIQWEQRDSRAWYFKPAYEELVQQGKPAPEAKSPSGVMMKAESGGGGTAKLDGQETSRGGLALLIVAQYANWIGFDLRVGVDGGDLPEESWRLTHQAGFFDAGEPAKEIRLSPQPGSEEVEVL